MSEGNTLLTRKVTIKNKASKSAYYAKNAKVIELKPQRLGGSISAANAIKQQSTLLKKVMPVLTGVDPSDTKWHIHLSGYLDSITVLIPTLGKTINTSLDFFEPEDLTSFEKEYAKIIKDYSDAVKANPNQEAKAFKQREIKLINLEDKALTKSIPVDPNGYFVWRYALVHGEVANREADSGKSSRIRFFIFDDAERKRSEQILYKLRTNASKKFFEIADKKIVTKAILNLMFKELNEKNNVESLDSTDIQKYLFDYTNTQPKLFLELAEDPNLELKAKIEEYITLGILNRPVNSTMIINSENQDIIGHNMDEAIVFFKNPNNNIAVKRFAEKYNSQPK